MNATMDEFKLPVLGFVYGLTLSFWGFVAAGFGHGSYVIIGMAASPLGFFGIIACFLVLPIYWTIAGLALKRAYNRSYRSLFLTLLTLHYATMVPLLIREPFNDWDKLPKMFDVEPGILLAGGLVYVCGQIFVWARFRKTPVNDAVSAGAEVEPRCGADWIATRFGQVSRRRVLERAGRAGYANRNMPETGRPRQVRTESRK
jgi:hypothetical protein